MGTSAKDKLFGENFQLQKYYLVWTKCVVLDNRLAELDIFLFLSLLSPKTPQISETQIQKKTLADIFDLMKHC